MSVFAANEKPKSDAASNHSPKPIVSFDIDGEKGLNQFRWDLMTQSDHKARLPILSTTKVTWALA